MKYKDWENGRIYTTKEEAKKDYLNNIINDSDYLTDIAFDYGPSFRSVVTWIENQGLLKKFYLDFKDIFDFGAEHLAEEWLEDLEEIEED